MTLDPELIALLVHDLKNPLAALLSNLGFVRSTVRGDEMVSEAVLDCVLSSEVLQRLIENMSAMGDLEGRHELSASTSSVTEVLSSVEARMGRHAETTMFRLTTRAEPGIGRVQLSSRYFELALDNLIAASMVYAPSSTSVDVVARRIDASTVGVAVLDDGPPVDEAVKDRIVLKEAQGELKSAKGGRYGRAFGIYVAGLIARSSGGDLHIGVREGRTAFELRLPTAD